MLKIGKINKLRIVKEVDFGLYLDGEDYGEILLPKRYVPSAYEINDEIDVFIYCDSEDRLIATTEQAKAEVGDFVALQVVATTKIGAFLDWGLLKDLFVPLNEQQYRMKEGQTYVVKIFLDESERIVASSKLTRYLEVESSNFEIGEAVELMIFDESELGYKAIVNGTHIGLMFKSETCKILKIGERAKGFIKRIRDDGKIDLILHQNRLDEVSSVAENIIKVLRKKGGNVSINDKSSPAEIAEMFAVSKKVFKQAIGGLYKERKIIFIDGGIKINDD